MVYEIALNGAKYYACSECGLIYEDPVKASLCESWCSEHKTCNTDIARHAIGAMRAYRKGLRLT